jgi:hypothetical protein
VVAPGEGTLLFLFYGPQRYPSCALKPCQVMRRGILQRSHEPTARPALNSNSHGQSAWSGPGFAAARELDSVHTFATDVQVHSPPPLARFGLCAASEGPLLLHSQAHWPQQNAARPSRLLCEFEFSTGLAVASWERWRIPRRTT